MANKKRDINGYRSQLGRYKLKRSDILTLEKLLWRYADAREMKHAGVTDLPEGRKHMPRKFVDRYASVGTYRPFHFSFGWSDFGIHYAGVDWIYREDSVKFLSRHKGLWHTRYIELAAWPGIKVTFTPLSTTVYAQTQYATGRELKIMKDVVELLEEYISKLPASRLNLCILKSL